MIIIGKKCMNIKMKKSNIILMTINFTEESCIHHSCLHSIFISLFGLIFLFFQKRKIPIIITKILSFFETSKQNSSSPRLIFYLLDQIGTVAWSIAKLRPHLIQVIISLPGDTESLPLMNRFIYSSNVSHLFA